MKAITITMPALTAVNVNVECESRTVGQRDNTAAATTSTIALMNMVSRINAMRRSPRRAALLSEEVAARALPDFGRLDCGVEGERSTRSDEGSRFPQTKHSPLSSSFFTPQEGQYIRSQSVRAEYYDSTSVENVKPITTSRAFVRLVRSLQESC